MTAPLLLFAARRLGCLIILYSGVVFLVILFNPQPVIADKRHIDQLDNDWHSFCRLSPCCSADLASAKQGEANGTRPITTMARYWR
jgi:hypothetical protein